MTIISIAKAWDLLEKAEALKIGDRPCGGFGLYNLRGSDNTFLTIDYAGEFIYFNENDNIDVVLNGNKMTLTDDRNTNFDLILLIPMDVEKSIDI
jgi:CubicO group peptidase (beta-lactamase class C family)